MEFSCIPSIDDTLRWKSIYDVVSACGKARNPKSLAVEILAHLGELCSFDQALVYFFDGNRKICDQYLMNLEEHWSTLYLAHYFNTDNRRYSCYVDLREDSKKLNLDPNKSTPHLLDWDKEPPSEFVRNLIHPRGLKYTCGFVLFDLNGNYRTLIALDRVKKKNFGNDELSNLNLVIPHLNNLHRNFYYQDSGQSAIKRSTWETAKLTEREVEVANLMCSGISTANISRALHITTATTYKHIANIYKKMQVSSQQELLVRLLR